MSRYIPKAPKLQKSPVFTAPHKWDGSLPQLQPLVPLPPLPSLDANPFVRALSSPIRVDRTTKLIKIPRAILMTFSLFNNPQDEKLWLIPNVEGLQSGFSNGYGPNKIKSIQNGNKTWITMSSLELLMQSSNLTSPGDVKWNPSNWKIVNELYCRMMLKQLESKDESSDSLIIKMNEIDGIIDTYYEEIVINLNKIELDTPNFLELKSKLHDGMRIKNRAFIDTLIKFVSYNS
jgi:hypothetical protein